MLKISFIISSFHPSSTAVQAYTTCALFLFVILLPKITKLERIEKETTADPNLPIGRWDFRRPPLLVNDLS